MFKSYRLRGAVAGNVSKEKNMTPGKNALGFIAFNFFLPVAFLSLPVFIIRIILAFFRCLTNFLKENADIVRFYLNDTLG